VGEAGTIAATPAVGAAVLDAIKDTGVDWIDMPFTPLRMWEAMHTVEGAPPTEQDRQMPEHGHGSAGSGPTSPSEGGQG
jgi:hypothetical protein